MAKGNGCEFLCEIVQLDEVQDRLNSREQSLTYTWFDDSSSYKKIRSQVEDYVAYHCSHFVFYLSCFVYIGKGVNFVDP